MIFHGLCKRKLPESSDLMMYLDICIPDIFPSVYQLLTSIIVCPISSVSVASRASILRTEANPYTESSIDGDRETKSVVFSVVRDRSYTENADCLRSSGQRTKEAKFVIN